MQDYRFLTGPDDSSFCQKVRQALNEGWQLYGNPCYSVNMETGMMHCGQAVVKDARSASADTASSAMLAKT